MIRSSHPTDDQPTPSGSSAADDPDRALILACQDPDADEFEPAFEALYSRYRDRVYTIAFRMMGSTTDSMDVVQETFAILFRKISQFRFQSKFSTWLFRLVVNCCIDHKRRETARMPSGSGGRNGTSSPSGSAQRVDVEHALETPDSGAGPLTNAESSELGDHVHQSLLQLSQKLRAVLVLRYLEGLSYEELASTLQISLGTVKSRLARAHVAFENVLNGTLERFDYPFGPEFQSRRDLKDKKNREDDGVEGVA